MLTYTWHCSIDTKNEYMLRLAISEKIRKLIDFAYRTLTTKSRAKANKEYSD